MKSCLTILLALSVAACGYRPPPRTDTASPAYAADRETCEDKSASEVNAYNAKTGLRWFSSPVRRWGQITEATQSCMAGKGYGRLRWCTPDEISGGDRSGNVIVTSSGVQCSDPPRRPL